MKLFTKRETATIDAYSLWLDKENRSGFTCLGSIIKDVDGYFVFFSNEDNGGSWSAWMLIEIGNILNKMNKEWDDIVVREIGPRP